MELPRLMVAPNGARRTPDDHPALPMTIEGIRDTARGCHEAGAGAIHFHVRDKKGIHVLDAGLYTEALAEIAPVVPDMHLQITTEAVGRYSPGAMRKLARDVMPPGISIGIAEMIPESPTHEDISLYRDLTEAGTLIQHICYAPEDLTGLAELVGRAELAPHGIWCLFVIGHYSGRISDPAMISPFLAAAAKNRLEPDWAVCAFDREENACLMEAVALGGKLRVGFENSLFMDDGSIATDNAARIAEAAKLFRI